MSTPSASSAAQALYGTAVYGVDVYGSTDVFVADWTSTPALGRFASVKFQASTDGADVESEAGTPIGLLLALTVSEDVYEETPDPLMQVNGFVVLAESGGYL
jgi:thiamine monophosphate kinase